MGGLALWLLALAVGGEKMATYIDDGVLALDASLEVLALDLNDEIFRLVVPRYLKRDVQLVDLLLPFVGESLLLKDLLLLGSLNLCGSGFYMR